MNSPEEASPGGAMPELREGTLTEADLAAYAEDLRALASELRCQVRREGLAPPDQVSLEEAIERVRAGSAVQIQYEYAGARWRDTLMAAPGGHRLIRMKMIQEGS
jgi:hypothetical protein